MSTPLSIGIACFPTFGGSGIVATEIGLELARRGDRIHLVSAQPPRRLEGSSGDLAFHQVVPRGYPLFEQGEYTLALTSRLVQIAERHRLDLFHVHYAVPHATAAFLAQQILGAGAPRIITTLHGTDATLVGSDPSYLPVTRFSIERSDAVTVPSSALRAATYATLGVAASKPIEVIPNFVDTDAFTPPTVPPTEPTLLHCSNFRPLKRVLDVIAIFAEVRRQVPGARLLLIGAGPDRAAAEQRVEALGLTPSVSFLGEQVRVAEALQRAQVFLLPSESESFGLAALEAMSCAVPVVATRVGGLPEVVTEGEDGFLHPVGDVSGMAASACRLLTDAELRVRFGQRARATAVTRFARSLLVDRYEALYRRVLDRAQ